METRRTQAGRRSVLLGALVVALAACGSDPVTTSTPASATAAAPENGAVAGSTTATPTTTAATTVPVTAAPETTQVSTVAPVATTAPPSTAPAGNTYVLVHGAWSASFAWDQVVPLLEADGHTVITVDLPAHGPDMTPASEVTLASYRDAVIAAIGDRRDVILVGHSFGGFTISNVAEAIPDQIARLIYVAALIPVDGESATALSAMAEGNNTNELLVIDGAAGVVSIATDGLVDLFCADCPASAAAQLTDHPQPEPLGPLGETIRVTPDRFGRVPKAYLFTLEDRAVGLDLQRLVAGRVDLIAQTEMDTSHSPFLSVPQEFVTALESLAG